MAEDNDTNDDEVARFSLRLPLRLYDQLSEAAKSSGRSANSEMVFRLQASLAAEMPAQPLLLEVDKLDYTLDRLAKQLGVVATTLSNARIRMRVIKRRGGRSPSEDQD